MNILVTGGAGFIGSNVADAYLKFGHKVIVVDDLYSGRRENVSNGITFIEMDIRNNDLNFIFEKYRIEFVNHHAARGDVRGSIERPKEYADVNITGGINLLECSVKNRVKGLIYSSTGGCVYGTAKYFPTDERHPMQPMDPYGASKASFEIYLEVYRKLYDFQYTIFRYPNVFGPRQNPLGEAGVISIFAKRMLEGGDVTINGDGNQERDYVFVQDVVAANILATEKNANCAFNLGTGIGTNVNKIFSVLRKIIGYKKHPIHVSAKLGEVQRSILSSEKIYKEWKWKPEVNLYDGLQKTVEYIKSNEL